MRIQLERFLALAAGGLVAAGLAAGCTVSSGDDDGGGGANWLTGSGGSGATSTGGTTTNAGTGGLATGGTAAVAGGTAGTAAGGTATGGAPTCLGDTTLASPPLACADLPYYDVTCANTTDNMPEGLSVCVDYAVAARAGVMEELVECLAVLPSDADGACNLQHDATWACVASVEQQACTAATSTSFCEDVVNACSEITTATCVRAFNTLTPAAGNEAANCMATHFDAGCGESAWADCFPTEI